MRHSRLVMAGSVGLIAAGASIALLLSLDDPRAKTQREPFSSVAPLEQRELDTPPPPSPVYASTAAAKPRAAPRIEPALFAADDLPDSLDAVPSTPWREAQLARYTPQERSMLDYKLGLMSRMRECAAKIEAEGKVNLFLHYTTDPGTGVAKGSGVDPLDSSLDRDADESALDCVR
ncbi:MAG TPA: hypothetical protein VK524_33950, partial [Polyangiaceae bacterium]|nr:hypothetical protein [Polyangiaceae bacterium]